jgi:RHS repeat-associated protein
VFCIRRIATALALAAPALLVFTRPAAAIDCTALMEQHGGVYGQMYMHQNTGTCPNGNPDTDGRFESYWCDDHQDNPCLPNIEALTGFVKQCDSTTGPSFNTCSRRDTPCETCGHQARQDPTADPSAQVGDPVSLSTGALKQTATDVDLGRGLAFTRHYSSALSSALGHGYPVTSMGGKWRHGFQWAVHRHTIADTGETYVRIDRGTDIPAIFVWRGAASAWEGSHRGQGALAGGVSGALTYTTETGLSVDFGADDQPESFHEPGEPAIGVTTAGDVNFYSNGVQTLEVEHYPSGHLHAGKVKEVRGGEQTVGYVYGATRETLDQVTALDLGTVNPSDTIVWDYDYDSAGRLLSVVRTARGEAESLGTWTWDTDAKGIHRVASAQEAGLEQDLTFEWPDAAQLEQVRVKDGNGATLATATSNNGILQTVTDIGGPGIGVPFASSTQAGLRWKTRTDPNGNVTLQESHDPQGRPGRVVEGWVDDGDGVFDLPGDTYARRTEHAWHPRLARPLSITRESSVTGLLEAQVVFDYDSDGDASYNQAPTDLLRARIETGKTLDASGATVPAISTTRYAYNAAGQLVTVSGPRIGKNFTRHVYDAQGRRTATQRYLDGDGSSYLETTFGSFDALGNPQTVTDPNGRVTSFTYDALSRVKTATPPFAGTGSATLELQYDVDGRIERIDFPPDSDGADYFLLFDRDLEGNLLSIADATGDAIVYEYDRGRRSRATLRRGFVPNQNPGTILGDASFDYHDIDGRLLEAFNPLFGGGVSTEFVHTNGDALPDQIIDENGKPDSLLYDALDRLKKVEQIRTATYVTELAYDAGSNVASVVHGKVLSPPEPGKITTYLTDDLGRLVKVISPDTGTTLFGYDEAGNLIRKTEAVGTASARTTQYVYDGLDRLLTIDLPTNPDWTFSYDTDAAKNQKGRLAQATNGTVTTALEYTPRGHLAKESTTYHARRYDVVYTYDAAGNVKSIQTPGGTTMTYRYAGSRVKEVDVAHGSRLETIRGLTWLPFGPLEHAELPPTVAGTEDNVVTLDRAYNLRYQLSELDVTGPSGTILDRDYFYASTQAPGPNDPGPNLDQLVDHLSPDESRFYFYDELDRLSRATDLTGANLFQYGHDPAGNRTFKTDAFGTTSYAYEAGTDRLEAATGAEQMFYANDAYGNRIYAGSTPYAGVPTYGYNEQNRLVTAKDANGATVTSVYDAFGRRIAWQTLRFAYDQAGRILEVSNRTSPVWVGDVVWVEGEFLGRVENNVAAGVLAFAPPAIAHFVPRDPAGSALAIGATGSLLLLLVSVRRRSSRFAWASAASAGAVLLGLACTPTGLGFYWIYTDPIGFPLAMTNTPATPSQAKVIWRASYEPFGLATEELDPDGDGKQVRMPMRFPGQWWDFATNLHDNFHRTYDPATGRYLEADPIGQFGHPNRYSYVAANPVNALDPYGLIWETSHTDVHVGASFWARIKNLLAKSGLSEMEDITNPEHGEGSTRDLYQVWRRDPENPDRDCTYPLGTKRRIPQTLTTLPPNYTGPPVLTDPRNPNPPAWTPLVPNRAYEDVPEQEIFVDDPLLESLFGRHLERRTVCRCELGL